MSNGTLKRWPGCVRGRSWTRKHLHCGPERAQAAVLGVSHFLTLLSTLAHLGVTTRGAPRPVLSGPRRSWAWRRGAHQATGWSLARSNPAITRLELRQQEVPTGRGGRVEHTGF